MYKSVDENKGQIFCYRNQEFFCLLNVWEAAAPTTMYKCSNVFIVNPTEFFCV
jgi:hypothetical protein